MRTIATWAFGFACGLLTRLLKSPRNPLLADLDDTKPANSSWGMGAGSDE